MGATGITRISISFYGLTMTGWCWSMDRSPRASSPPWLSLGCRGWEATPRCPGGCRAGWASITLWGLGGEPDQADETFYFTVLKLWTLRDCSSPEVSCEMTRLSVCLGLPAEGLVSLTPRTPCGASLSLPSLEKGGHLQANAAWSLPSVQGTWVKLRNLRGLIAASLCTLRGGHLQPLQLPVATGEQSYYFFFEKKKLVSSLLRSAGARVQSHVPGSVFWLLLQLLFIRFYKILAGIKSTYQGVGFYESHGMWKSSWLDELWLHIPDKHNDSIYSDLAARMQIDSVGNKFSQPQNFSGNQPDPVQKKCIQGSRLGLQKYVRLLFHVRVPVS